MLGSDPDNSEVLPASISEFQKCLVAFTLSEASY